MVASFHRIKDAGAATRQHRVDLAAMGVAGIQTLLFRPDPLAACCNGGAADALPRRLRRQATPLPRQVSSGVQAWRARCDLDHGRF